jgi:hypothetical protein
VDKTTGDMPVAEAEVDVHSLLKKEMEYRQDVFKVRTLARPLSRSLLLSCSFLFLFLALLSVPSLTHKYTRLAAQKRR